jgi:glutamine synthetase type III
MLLSNASAAASREREGNDAANVTIKEVHDLTNALNNSVAEIEKSNNGGNINDMSPQEKMKYEKLKEMLNDAQNQKSKFERVIPKPTKWGVLKR